VKEGKKGLLALIFIRVILAIDHFIALMSSNIKSNHQICVDRFLGKM